MDTSIIILLLLVMGVIFMYLDIRRPNSFISRFLDRKHGEQWFVDRDSEEWNGNDLGENLVYTDVTRGPFVSDAVRKLAYERDMYQKMKDDDMAFQNHKLVESDTPQESCNTAPKPKSKKKRKYTKRKRESTKLEKKRVYTTRKRTKRKKK